MSARTRRRTRAPQRRRQSYRRQPARRGYGRPARRRSGGQPSMFWGRALMTVVVLFCIWAWAKGQA